MNIITLFACCFEVKLNTSVNELNKHTIANESKSIHQNIMVIVYTTYGT